MKVTGIIAEYNPFHNGHAYQIQQIKEQLNSDYIIVVMSGDFVQRGEPAILDKYERARMALICGADLVLELPVLFSTASAPYFANGGVRILDALGCVDQLCFGTESGILEDFYQIAELLIQEPEMFKERLSSFLKQGMSFPLARSKALSELIPDAAVLLSSPNSILGIEYTRSLLELKSTITPYPILRKGNSYHSEELEPLASATAIRKSLFSGESTDSVLCALPEKTKEYYQELFQQNRYLCSDSFSSILGYQLLRLTSPNDLSNIFDINPYLANRIFQNRDAYQTMDQYAELLKTRNETLLHMKRSLLHLLLALPVPDEHMLKPSYTRILGMKRSASPLLKVIKEKSTIPVLTRLANADDIFKDIYADLPERRNCVQMQLSQSTFASNLYQMQLSQNAGVAYRHEYTRQFPIIN